MAAGQISTAIPFIRREAFRVLRTTYANQHDAAAGIDRAMRASVGSTENGASETALRQAIVVLQTIYLRNVFPTMNIAWGTYPDRIGHTTSQGCFRCHDAEHVAEDGRVLGQDCEGCHTIE